ncbi:MAG TPA: chemotaxis protein CheD [Nitrospirota bacterium]|jgi:chemotaxis protein CheD
MAVINTPFRVVDLKPGEIHVAHEPTFITTLLGSCVSVCLFSACDMLGAMSHSVLPEPRKRTRSADLRYVECAISRMLDGLRRMGAKPPDITAKLFGGAEMFARPGQGAGIARMVGDSNTGAARAFLELHGVSVVSESVGGQSGRKVIFNTATGVALVRRVGPGCNTAAGAAYGESHG